MQITPRAGYTATQLEEIRRRDREAKRRQRQRRKDLAATQILPMGEFEGPDRTNLYLLRYDFDPCQTMGIKVGRSENVSMRKAQLEEGHAFQCKILRVYPGCGHLEYMVHKLLACKRITGGSSREWFDVSFDTAMLAVRLARALYSEPGAFSQSESSSDYDSNQPTCTTSSPH